MKKVDENSRAAVLVGPGSFEVHEVGMPRPEAGQVLVRLEGCGVCASNVAPYEGREWFEYPFAAGGLGHEGWGEVQEVGEGVTAVGKGDRVAMLSYHAFATHDVADEGAVVRLPDTLVQQPFPGEPLGCAMNIFARSDIKAGQQVAIVGAGFLGSLLTALAQGAGAQVMAISRRPFSLKMAEYYGASRTILMDDHDKVIAQVMELTGGQGCHRVIEATGVQWPLDLAGELTRTRGKLVIAGYHQDGPRQVNMQMWNWRGLDVINAHEREQSVYMQGIRDAVEAQRSGRLDPRPLYTHEFELEQIGAALEMTRTRPDGFMKALIRM